VIAVITSVPAVLYFVTPRRAHIDGDLIPSGFVIGDSRKGQPLLRY